MPCLSTRNRTKRLKPGCRDAPWTDACVCVSPSLQGRWGSALLSYSGTLVALVLPPSTQGRPAADAERTGDCAWHISAARPAIPLAGTHSQGHSSAGREAGIRSLVVRQEKGGMGLLICQQSPPRALKHMGRLGTRAWEEELERRGGFATTWHLEVA